jgi:hypothetical protein
MRLQYLSVLSPTASLSLKKKKTHKFFELLKLLENHSQKGLQEISEVCPIPLLKQLLDKWTSFVRKRENTVRS